VKAIIGTAGHIDHGKSALVRALSGIETDRLPEERERGISIELGFAYLELPDGDRAGIVDVPGHERFVRQMLAGAQGFDLMLMVIAADDGVMPQTEEHFEICHLLGVQRGLFVITKTDLVDAARIEDVRGEIEILAVGTVFEDAEIFAVSAQTGDGIDAFRSALIEVIVGLEREDGSGPYRMPIDRAFVLKGHGTVVTGTAAGGSVAPGDDVEIVPGDLSARVREVQVHDRPVERASQGQRVALNLAGVERDEVGRGKSVVAPGLAASTNRFDARVEIRPSAGKAVKSHTRVRVHLGTAEVDGRVIWIDGSNAVAPRERAYAQLALAEDAVAFARDRFVLRDETASRTLGGGTVLVTRAERHRKTDPTSQLSAIEEGTVEEQLVALVEMSSGFGVAPQALALGAGIETAGALEVASELDQLILFPSRAEPSLIVARSRYDALVDQLVTAAEEFHADNPKSPGIELESLRQTVSRDLDARLFRIVVDEFVGPDLLVRRGSTVSRPGHKISMSVAEEKLADKILASISADPTKPPSLKELREALGLEPKRLTELVGVLCDRGDLVRVSSDLVFMATVVTQAEARLRDHLAANDQITAAEFRDLISASRKYSIPLLDYFDRSGITVRTGDYRRLR
jgi:selenocysteine-specific elongation factor